MTEYNPLRVWPILHVSSHDFGIPVTATCPLHSKRPSVWTPDDVSSWVRPKFKREMGRISFLVITPVVKCLKQKWIVCDKLKEFKSSYKISLAVIGQLNRCRRITVAIDTGINAISIDSALTGVNSWVAFGPEILRISTFVVPPTIWDCIKLQRGKVTIVLFK